MCRKQNIHFNLLVKKLYQAPGLTTAFSCQEVQIRIRNGFWPQEAQDVEKTGSAGQSWKSATESPGMYTKCPARTSWDSEENITASL